jgi:hypothetical protein
MGSGQFDMLRCVFLVGRLLIRLARSRCSIRIIDGSYACMSEFLGNCNSSTSVFTRVQSLDGESSSEW